MSTRTVSDCLEHARSVADGEARTEHLRQAELLAQCDSDWRRVGQAYAQGGDRDAALRCLDTAISIAPNQTWCFADKAELLRDAFNDVPAASSVLHECEANLAANAEAPVYAWSLLARHFHTIVGDLEAARQCLEQGAQRAQSVDDLCSIARAFGALLEDNPRANSLLQRAMPLAREAAGRTPQVLAGFWTIASVLSALGETRSARTFLDEGLELAESVDGCVTLAQAWAGQSVDQETSARRCLERAESFASSSTDWLSIAEAYHGHAHDLAGCRKALERATVGADRTALSRVAFGFAHWLSDAARAGAVAPRGVRPEDLVVRRKPLEGWHADSDSLLALLLAAVTDEALDSIADADYGYKRDDNRAALEDMRTSGLVPVPMVSPLHEVMALTRWSAGERSEHVGRALACTLLCLDVLHPDAFTEDITEALASLVESCWKLGPNEQRALTEFLVWLIEVIRGAEEQYLEDEDEDEDAPVKEEDLDSCNALAAHYALLLTQLFVEPSDPRLDRLSASVIEIEQRMSSWMLQTEDAAVWMSRVLRSIRDELWSQLATEALSQAEQVAPDSVAVRTLRPLLE